MNMYGITETTVHVTYRPICQADLTSGIGNVIGIPIPDLRVYLLDEKLAPVPIGVAGEICVAGSGVSRVAIGIGRTDQHAFCGRSVRRRPRPAARNAP